MDTRPLTEMVNTCSYSPATLDDTVQELLLDGVDETLMGEDVLDDDDVVYKDLTLSKGVRTL